MDHSCRNWLGPAFYSEADGVSAPLTAFAPADGRAPTRLYQAGIHLHSPNHSLLITEPNSGSQYSIITYSMQSQMEISAGMCRTDTRHCFQHNPATRQATYILFVWRYSVKTSPNRGQCLQTLLSYGRRHHTAWHRKLTVTDDEIGALCRHEAIKPEHLAVSDLQILLRSLFVCQHAVHALQQHKDRQRQTTQQLV